MKSKIQFWNHSKSLFDKVFICSAIVNIIVIAFIFFQTKNNKIAVLSVKISFLVHLALYAISMLLVFIAEAIDRSLSLKTQPLNKKFLIAYTFFISILPWLYVIYILKMKANLI
jgi:hypothetical protein